MSAVPRKAQRPWASLPAIGWFLAWATVAFTAAFSQGVILFVICMVIAGLGAAPLNEGPVFKVAYKKMRFRWKVWRIGTTYRRELSSTQLDLQRGVSPLKGHFKAEIALLKFTEPGGKLRQFPVLLNGKNHTVTVESGTNPTAAMADPGLRQLLKELEAQLYVDLAEILGRYNSLTIWSLHRGADDSSDAMYMEERFEPAIQRGETEEDLRKLQEFADSQDEITQNDWDRRYGIALTATHPATWKARRLDKLTIRQVLESPAVLAAIEAETKMEGVGIADAKVSSFPSYTRLLRDIMSVNNVELSRERALLDIVRAATAEADGEIVDTKTMYTDAETPFPTMQREVANDYMIFDGTYHRVMWVTDYLSRENFDQLHTARCNYYVGIHADIQLATRDDSRRQDKARLQWQLLEMFKRNVTAQDEAELETLDEERYDALAYGQYVVYFRTIVIVSGKSLDDLERNQKILTDHLARNNVRVQLHTVTGADQLEWFFAALGSFGVSR